MSGYLGTHADGSRGMIINTSENTSLCGINVTQEEWDRVFGKKDHSRQRGYKYRCFFDRRGKVVEEIWFDTVECRRITVNDEVVEFYEGDIRKVPVAN